MSNAGRKLASMRLGNQRAPVLHVAKNSQVWIKQPSSVDEALRAYHRFVEALVLDSVQLELQQLWQDEPIESKQFNGPVTFHSAREGSRSRAIC